MICTRQYPAPSGGHHVLEHRQVCSPRQCDFFQARFASCVSLSHRIDSVPMTFRVAASSIGRVSLILPSARQSGIFRKYSTMSNLLQGCTFKNALLKAEGPSMGVWQTLPGANISRILARAGVEWVLVDCEHGNIDGVDNLSCTHANPLILHQDQRLAK